ncbi:MAG: hypothetical protein ACP5N2_03590 [Candidatus Nanoarchaeia archaeon]
MLVEKRIDLESLAQNSKWRTTVLNEAKKELKEKGELDSESLEAIIAIAKLPKPDNWKGFKKKWPHGKSQVYDAFKLIKLNAKQLLFRWSRSARIKDKEINRYACIDDAITNIAKDIVLSDNLERSITSSKFNSLLMKNLYKHIEKYEGQYIFLEDAKEDRVAILVEGIKENDQTALLKLYGIYGSDFMKRLYKYSIPKPDKETIIKLALWSASQNLLFLGGFKTYVAKYLKKEVIKYFKDTSFSSHEYTFRNLLETEIADLESIKLFEKDIYEDLYEMSWQVNHNKGFLKVDSVSLPKNVVNKIYGLMHSEGKFIGLYVQEAIKAMTGRLNSNERISENKLVELFQEKYAEVSREIIERSIENYESGNGSEEILELYRTEKKLLLENEQERVENANLLLIEKQQAGLGKIQIGPKQLYLSILARVLVPSIEGKLSSDALCLGSSEEGIKERLDNIQEWAQLAAKRKEQFEFLPEEFRKEVILSQIFDHEITEAKKYKFNLVSYFLEEGTLKRLSTLNSVFNSPQNINQELYLQGYLLTDDCELKYSVYGYNADQIPKLLFSGTNINSNDDVFFVFNKDAYVVKEAELIKTKSSHILENVLLVDNESVYALVPRENKGSLDKKLNVYFNLSEDLEKQFKEYGERYEFFKEKVKDLYLEYLTKGFSVPSFYIDKEYISSYGGGKNLVVLVDENDEVFFNPVVIMNRSGDKNAYLIPSFNNDAILESIDSSFEETFELINAKYVDTKILKEQIVNGFKERSKTPSISYENEFDEDIPF